jgi:hypothetical protein
LHSAVAQGAAGLWGLVRIVVMKWSTWLNGLPPRLPEDNSSMIQLAPI